MVQDDPYYVKKVESTLSSSTDEGADSLDEMIANPMDRAAAVVADMLLFSPIIAVIVAPFRSSAIEAELLGNQDALMHAYYSAAFTALIGLILVKTIFHAAFGATPGQRFMRLEVVSVWTGEKPRPMEAFIRACVWCLDCVLVAPLAALYGNEKRRPLHDRAADTVVLSTDAKRKSAGPPSLPEMSMAGGFQAAILTALTISICMQMLRPASSSDEQLVKSLEADGKLCKEVSEAHAEWEKGPSRLNVALSLFAAEALDSGCLRQEADFSLWTNEEKSLGYLAKGLTEEPESREKYFVKACPGASQTDVCQTVAFLRALDVKKEFEDPDNAEQKAQRVENENELESLVAMMSDESPTFLKIWASSHLLETNHFAKAIEILDQIPPQKKLGLFMARERAMALWQVGETEKSRTSFQTSAALLAPPNRVELARWFCAEETAGGTCSESKASACNTLYDTVEHMPNLMMVSGVSAAFVRTEICRTGGVLTPERVKEISERIPEKSGQSFIDALAKLGTDERQEGLATLEELATAKDDDDPFYLEANLKLADLATDATTLEPVKKRWMALKPESDSWRGLGLKVTARLSAFGQWSEALENGLKLLRSEKLDRKLHELLVVAAYRSGRVEMASKFLAQMNPSEVSTERIPASEPGDFEKVVHDLKEGPR